jgi:asparagine synthase (glutamine-hydrolysing)
MCGIVGIFHYRSGDALELAHAERMTEALTHRGPDEGAVWGDGQVALGNRRLSIVDIANGRQPMPSADGALVITYNGELFNFADLRDELTGRGYAFRTRSDTEVVLRAYEAWGTDCLERFNGQFAFAIWDSRRRGLFLARDHVGVCPLHLWIRDGKLVFASEAKALFEHPEIKAEPDPFTVCDLLTSGCLFEGRTAFRGVSILAPGTWLWVDERGVGGGRFWSMPTAEPPDGPRDEMFYRERLLPLLDSAVRTRRAWEVPWGVILSGGTDSSMLTTLASRDGAEPVRTFTIGFPNPWSSDGSDVEYARLLAERLGTRHHEFLKSSADYFDVLEALCWHVERPFNKGAATLFLLYKEVRAASTVVLTGDGADEIFGGYIGSRGMGLTDLLDGGAPQCFPWAPHWREGLSLLSRDVRETCQPGERMRHFLDEGLREAATLEPVNRGLYLYAKYFLSELIELHDRTSMAFGVETRLPFTDKPFLECFLPMPAKFKYRDGVTKFLFREMADPLLPREIVNRKKMHLPIPRDPVALKRQLRLTRELLFDSGARSAVYLDRRKVEELLTQSGEFAGTDMVVVWQLTLYLITLETHQRVFGL